jgi:acetoin utilization protein AcuC
VDEVGGPGAEGTAVNLPLEAHSGDDSWWPAVQELVTAVADAFEPTFLVSQHGCDSHAWDPLAHLRVTTAAYAGATRLLDEVAHRWCEGRWFATGGGGYDVYRVVPRSWALVWLAQAHLPVPERLPEAWLERWGHEADRHRGGPLPGTFLDATTMVGPEPNGIAERNAATRERTLRQALRLLAARA